MFVKMSKRSVVMNLKPIFFSFLFFFFLVFVPLGFLFTKWSQLNHPLVANMVEIVISILAGNLNSGRSYLITTVH